MASGDGTAWNLEALNASIREIESKWETLRPNHTGGVDLPSDDQILHLARDLTSRRSGITDVTKLHILDMLLHLFSLWPKLPQVTRHYTYNMANLFSVALPEGWNVAARHSNGFSTVVVAPPERENQVLVAAESQPSTSGPNNITPQGRNAAVQNTRAEPPNEMPGSPLRYNPKCNCEKVAIRLQVKKDTPNKGRFFYKCWKHKVRDPVDPCNFFKFEDELPVTSPRCCGFCKRPGHDKNHCPYSPT